MATMNEGKKLVLLVEDDGVIALATARQLERFGFAVAHAFSGDEALSLDAELSPDLVLMDVDLGEGMDGPTTGERILARRDVPLVFLSSHSEPEIVELTERVTSYGYVLKHAGPTVLGASIRMAFRLFDTRLELKEHIARLTALSDNIPSGGVYQIHAVGAARRFTYLSAGMGRLHEIDAEAALEDSALIYGQVLASDRPRLAAMEEDARKTLSTFRAELTMVLPSGERRRRLLTSAPRALPDGSTLWDGIEIDLGPA
jgi:CheY-like chemotaxis protein